MPISTISSREFNQESSRAKRAANDGPVFITERGKRSHVLLSIAEYQKLTGTGMTLAEALAMPESDHIEFDPEPLKGPLFRPEEYS